MGRGEGLTRPDKRIIKLINVASKIFEILFKFFFWMNEKIFIKVQTPPVKLDVV